MMVKSAVEVILEECGWSYDTKDDAWHFDKFKVSRAKLYQALEEGKGKVVREKIIETLQSGGEIEATIERLKPRKKGK